MNSDASKLATHLYTHRYIYVYETWESCWRNSVMEMIRVHTHARARTNTHTEPSRETRKGGGRGETKVQSCISIAVQSRASHKPIEVQYLLVSLFFFVLCCYAIFNIDSNDGEMLGILSRFPVIC